MKASEIVVGGSYSGKTAAVRKVKELTFDRYGRSLVVYTKFGNECADWCVTLDAFQRWAQCRVYLDEARTA